MKLPERMENNRLPAFAFPGGYPMYYLCADNGVLCPDCANGDNGSEASETSDENQWKLVGCDVHYEGQPIQCDHCNGDIESAYGDPDVQTEEDQK